MGGLILSVGAPVSKYCFLEGIMGNVVVYSVHFQKKLLRMVRDLLALPPGMGSTPLTET